MLRTRPTVSLIMIVRDEERNLADCLTPIAPLFDEILIVDTGSQDETKQVAGRFTDKVFDFPWCDDFSAARNESLRHATGDWIFWLDADDRLTPGNLARLAELLEQLDDRPCCYFMDTASHRRFECDGVQLHSHPRLFRRHESFHWRGHVHEQLRPEPIHLGYENVWTDIQIDHLGYQSPAQTQRKLRRNLRLLAMDYAIDPSEPSTLLHLGMAHAELGNRAEARKFLQQIALTSDRGLDHMRRVYHTLADLAVRDGQRGQALAIVEQGLEKFPGDDSLLFQRAEILGQMQRFAEAEQSLIEILHVTPTRKHHGGPGEIRNKLAPRKLAELLASQGRFDEATQLARAILADYPEDARTWYLIGGILMSSPDRTEFDAVCRELKKCPQGDFFAATLEAGWHLWRSEPAAAIPYIDWLIAEIPEAPLPRVLRCHALAMLNAPVPQRIAACRDALRVEPHNQSILRDLAVLQAAPAVVRAAPAPAALAPRPAAQPVQNAWSTSIVCTPGMPTA